MNEKGVMKLEMTDIADEPRFLADTKNRNFSGIEFIKRRRTEGNV